MMDWFHAVTQNDAEAIRQFVARGFDIEGLHPLRQTTALAEATRRGQHDIALLLLQLGAAPDFLCGARRMNPLHLAMQNQDWLLLEALLQATASCNRCDGQGRNLLHLLAVNIVHSAEEAKALRLAEIIIAKGIAINALDGEGVSPLHYTVINDWENLAELLLMRGANPNLRAAETGITPLIIAALEGNRTMAQLMLQHGADITHCMHDGANALSIMPRLIEDVPEPIQAEIIALYPQHAPKVKPAKKQSSE